MLDFCFSGIPPFAADGVRGGAAGRDQVHGDPHTLRHSFATRFLAKNQGDIATLAMILGHANISTTTRYLHPSARRMQEMVEEM